MHGWMDGWKAQLFSRARAWLKLAIREEEEEEEEEALMLPTASTERWGAATIAGRAVG